jgi:anti-anti-sigma factor
MSANLRASTRHEGKTLTLAFAGEADLEASPTIRRLLADAHEDAQRLGVDEVALNLTDLEFASAPSLRPITALVARVARLPEATAYRIRLIASAGSDWQRRTLPSLCGLAPSRVTLDASG